MVSLYTKIDQLRLSSLRKHKANLYFKEATTVNKAVREKRPNTELFLVRIFLYLNQK